METLQVETFEDIHSSECIPEFTEDELIEYNEMAVDLGLHNLVVSKEKNSDNILLPKMNRMERSVYKALCPQSFRIEDYDGFVPPRVMKSLAKAKQILPDKMTFKIYTADTVDDPVLIASNSEYSMDSSSVLIARWGAELLDFPTLKSKALEVWRQKVRKRIASAKTYIAKYEADKEAFILDCLERDYLGSID